jgi:hypothetical protein
MKLLGVAIFVLLFGLFLTNPGDRLDAEIRNRMIDEALAEADRGRGRGNPAEQALFDGLARPVLAAALSVAPQSYGLFTLYDIRGPILRAGRLGEPRRCLGAANMLWMCWAG